MGAVEPDDIRCIDPDVAEASADQPRQRRWQMIWSGNADTGKTCGADSCQDLGQTQRTFASGCPTPGSQERHAESKSETTSHDAVIAGAILMAYTSVLSLGRRVEDC